MSADAQRLSNYLGHILEAIERIRRYTDDMDEIRFSQNDMTQDAVIRNLEIIGEASRNIARHYPDFATRIVSFRFHSPTKCAMPSLTDISKSIWRSCGRPSKPIFHTCISRSKPSSTLCLNAEHREDPPYPSNCRST